MRDPKRIDRIINKVRAFWHTNPDWRFHQLISNVSDGLYIGGDGFYVEDDNFEKQLDRWMEEYQ